MKLKRGDVIVYSPRLVGTISDSARDEHFALGVVESYDKYADVYDIDIGYDVLMASIVPNEITKDNLKVVGRL